MRNEFFLHEMMVHVPILAHGAVERVLIVGAAGRELAAEVRKHRLVQDVGQVHADQGGYLATTAERFDLILAPTLPETSLRHARGCLKPGGVVVATLGAPFVQPRGFFASVRSLASVYARVGAWLVPVPGAFGGPVALGWGSNVLSPGAVPLEILAARFAGARIETRYYTPEVHRASFALPRFVSELVRAATSPHEEMAIDALDGAQAYRTG